MILCAVLPCNRFWSSEFQSKSYFTSHCHAVFHFVLLFTTEVQYTNKQTFYFDITERQQNKETQRIVCIKLSTERTKTEENCATVSKKNLLSVKKKYSREKKNY